MTKKAHGGPELADYVQAGYPCLFLRTVEPQVAEQQVRSALEELDMGGIQLGVWKATTGLVVKRADAPEQDDGRQAAMDLTDAFNYVEKSREPIVGVFHNLRQMIGQYQNIQCLIDATFAARIVGSCVVLIGPYIDLPPELKNIITIVDISLPSQEQLVEEFSKLIRAYEKEIILPKKKSERQELIVTAARAAIGLDRLGAENALALSMSTSERVDIQIIQKQKEQEVRKSDVLEFWPVDQTIGDVGGFDYYKTWWERRERVFSTEAREYGLPYPKGVLIVGPAGTGKSLAAKATAHYLKLPLLRLDMGRIFRSLVGESEAAARMALQVTEAVSPVVLWMDEAEKGLAGMAGSGELDSGVTSRVISTILTWRQETTAPVILVMTANNVTTIPAMVYRKGRLDEVWATDLPLEHERVAIFAIHIRKRGRDPEDYDLQSLASLTHEFTGAEIEGCIEDCMFTAFDEGEEFTNQHIIQSIRETVPQAIRDKEELVSIRTWARSRARSVSSGQPPEIEGEAKDKTRNVRKLHPNKKK